MPGCMGTAAKANCTCWPDGSRPWEDATDDTDPPPCRAVSSAGLPCVLTDGHDDEHDDGQ